MPLFCVQFIVFVISLFRPLDRFPFSPRLMYLSLHKNGQTRSSQSSSFFCILSYFCVIRKRIGSLSLFLFIRFFASQETEKARKHINVFISSISRRIREAIRSIDDEGCTPGCLRRIMMACVFPGRSLFEIPFLDNCTVLTKDAGKAFPGKEKRPAIRISPLASILFTP